jgi:hypothetical protein
LWDWVDGNFELEEITREMEIARSMGLGGFDIWDVRSVVDEDSIVPAGPPFMSEASVGAIVHAIREAKRLELDLGLIIASGWNAGGSWTLPRHQTMGLFRSDTTLRGPGSVEIKLAFPALPDKAGKTGRQFPAIIPRDSYGLPVFYEDVCVVAIPLPRDANAAIPAESVMDLSDLVDEHGELNWEVPAGEWRVTRYVCTNTGQPMISSSPNSRGPMIDHFSAEASEYHINYFIDKLEDALGEPIGESGLTYFYTDSYEVQGQLWTPGMKEMFAERFGYSLVPYLPVLEGQVVDNPTVTSRFLYDFRRILSDLIIENHYTRTREICEAHGVGFVAEAAGPGWPVHDCPFESIKSSGSLTFPRGEFWHLPVNSAFWLNMRGTERERHYLEELQVIKGVASASHLYDQKYVEAEAFTGTHLWNEGPGDLKPTADRAFCEGLNRIIFHTWPHTPSEAGVPGWVYAFGTLMNETRIWWPMARPWMEYLGRCSFMLQQGNFVGDVLFYYGDSVPNFVPAKKVVPGLGAGYDYDVANTDILMTRLQVKEGKLVLPHGPSYEMLVLPEETYMQPEILRKIEELVKAGATVAGPKPVRSHGLFEREERDMQVRTLAERLWGDCNGDEITHHAYGEGHIYWGIPLRSILIDKGVYPDLEVEKHTDPPPLDFIHRRCGETDLYFVRNCTPEAVHLPVTIRQNGKKAQRWDPVTGGMFGCQATDTPDGRSRIDLSLEGYGSLFLVFSAESGSLPSEPLLDVVVEKQELTGSWEVFFPPEDGGAGRIHFDTLVLWNQHELNDIRFFSGIATYRKAFQWNRPETPPGSRTMLEFDKIVEVARVQLNGKDLGILWNPPYRVDVTGSLQPGNNDLRVQVANTWANGLAGDAKLPVAARRTRTNVTRLPNAWSHPFHTIPNEYYDLIESGLAGEVTLVTYETE